MLPPGTIHINQQQVGCFIHKQHKINYLTISYNAARHIRKAAKHSYTAAMTVCTPAKHIYRAAKHSYTAAMTVRRPAKHIRRPARHMYRAAKHISTPANAICNAAKNSHTIIISNSCHAGSCHGRSPPTTFVTTTTHKTETKM